MNLFSWIVCSFVGVLLTLDVPDVAAFKAEGFKGAETWLCTGKIRRTRPCYVSAFQFLANNVPKDEVKYIKMTMVFFFLVRLTIGGTGMVPFASRRQCIHQGSLRQ
jgi:hypothetical protein